MSDEFRRLLQEELVRRVGKNARYSLRAYAQSLNTDFSTLAKLLRGERPLGTKTINRLGTELGLSPQEIDGFLAKGKSKGALAQARSTTYRVLSSDQHHIAKDWYHDAILELMLTKSFEGRIPWISRALGISVAETRLAVERLQRAGLLHIDEHNKWHDTSGGFTTILGEPELASVGKARQKQVLQKALDALDDIPVSMRDQTSVTVAVSKSRMDEVKKRIQAFRRELAEDLGSDAEIDDVYHLSISFYPVSRVNDEKLTKDKKTKER